ncbi:MAG: SIS domain-containing protein [Chloroflexi bacterium]|nr:SIS domain-containing protein [Chloroflexota bacterium]
MSRLLQEIMEQPSVLEGLLNTEYGVIQEVAAAIRERHVRAVLIAARGTSDNAATYAKYLWGAFNGLPVMLAAPSLYTFYQRPPRLHDTLVVGISQSGMSPDVVAVVEDGRAQGMLTLAITNDAQSRLAHAAEYVLSCRAGEERSVAATKSYTAELMVIALLSVALAEDSHRLEEARRVPEAVEKALALEKAIAQRAERYRFMTSCAVVGRGFNYATAFEVALKVKELTYVSAQPYSSADFMHGPVAIVGRDYPVIAIAPSGRVYNDLAALVAELKRREAELVIISDREDLARQAQVPLILPTALPEWLSPITAVIPGQLLAYHLALTKGLDPEQPRGLRKVTETR